MTDFISKLYLKEYQRSLIPYFKRYLLTEIDGDRKTKVFEQEMLGSAAQNLIGEDEEAEAQRIADLNLMEQIREIPFVENATDLAIMYEITGYQGEKTGDDDFWANYESYREAGWSSQMAINQGDDDT